MGFFDFFKTNKVEDDSIMTDNSVPSEEVEEAVDVPKNVFVCDDEPTPSKKAYPIYLVYERLDEDYEDRGYKDASKYRDKNMMNNQIDVIKKSIDLLFEKTLLQYNDMLLDIDLNIKLMQENGMIDTANRLTVKKELMVNHINIINAKKKELSDGTLFDIIKKSYMSGYIHGMMDLSEEAVSKLM